MSDNFTLFFENRHYPKGKSGPDFKRDFNFPHRSGVAFFNQNTFFASGINDGGSVYFENRAAATFAKLKDWVKEAFGDDTPVESEYQPGTVYYRIFRPVITGSFYRPISQEKLT